MRDTRRFGIAALVLSAIAFGCGGAPVRTPPPVVSPEPPPSFHADSETCGACHKTLYDQWRNSRHALSWTSETFLTASENYTKTECLPCHAPDLILRAGFDLKPDTRTDVRERGVTCVVCHQDATAREWKMHGPYAVESPSHASAENPAYATSDVCAPCHGEKAEFDQYHPWKASNYGESGFPCQACHAAPSERLLADTDATKPKRWVADHRFLGAYDDAILRAAATLAVTAEEAGFRVHMTNQAGHAFPGGAYREATLTVSVDDKAVDTVLFSFETSHRLASGETWTKFYPSSGAGGDPSATLRFRRTVGNDTGAVIAEARLGSKPSE